MKRSAALLLAAALPSFAVAADDGIATRGATGGLTIPSGSVLESGGVAFTASDYQEPRFGSNSRRRNFSFGIGLAPNVELFGRYANYENPLPDSTAINGARDISANLKFRLPQFWRSQPEIALGVTDIGGGASNFGSAYVVASDRFGFMDWTLGYARGGTLLGKATSAKLFDGVFGGLQLRAGETGLSAIAEYDGRQKYAGVRYRSPGFLSLGGTYFVASVQRSFGDDRLTAATANAKTSATVSLVVPLSGIAERPRTFKPEHALKPQDSQQSGMAPTPEDRLEALQKALVATRLERVRVGTLDRDLVVEYENHLFGQTEADALGVVLGLGSEYAPAGTVRLRAVTLKAGLPVYTTSVGVAEYRGFLRTGDSNYVGGSLALDPGAAAWAQQVRWQTPVGRRSWVHLQLEPELVNTVATELAVFDYSLAANLKTFVPLWRGAELYVSYIDRLSNTNNFEPGNFFGAFRQRSGIRVAALQQSLWLGRHMLVTAGVGRYRYDSVGAELESTLFFPGRSDVIRFKAAAYERQPGETRARTLPASATYRWVPSADTWVEAGFQQYTDGTRGPSVVLTRWFGEVGANLFLRRGGSRTFGGLELTIPLTPRRGAEVAGITFNGTQQFTKGVRTRILTGSGTNFVELGGVVDFPLQYNAEARLLNGGHVSEKYFIARLHRMREAFYVYARDALPE